MKKLIMSAATGILLLLMTPAQASEAIKRATTSSITVKNIESMEVEALVNRVNEINAMDKSSMSVSEKKEVRSELRAIKREVNRRGDVVYISVGLVVLIIVLIIVL